MNSSINNASSAEVVPPQHTQLIKSKSSALDKLFPSPFFIGAICAVLVTLQLLVAFKANDILAREEQLASKQAVLDEVKRGNELISTNKLTIAKLEESITTLNSQKNLIENNIKNTLGIIASESDSISKKIKDSSNIFTELTKNDGPVVKVGKLAEESSDSIKTAIESTKNLTETSNQSLVDLKQKYEALPAVSEVLDLNSKLDALISKRVDIEKVTQASTNTEATLKKVTDNIDALSKDTSLETIKLSYNSLIVGIQEAQKDLGQLKTNLKSMASEEIKISADLLKLSQEITKIQPATKTADDIKSLKNDLSQLAITLNDIKAEVQTKNKELQISAADKEVANKLETPTN